MLFLCRPEYKERIWGSLSFESLRDPVGEVWWLYRNEEGSTSLLRLKGTGDSSLEALVNEGYLPDDPFWPVMIKTLHTSDRLSVQVHPGIRGGPFKEETWIVLKAEADSWMMGGVRTRSPKAFMQAMRDGRAEGMLNRVRLSPGDIYHIPPGTVHALGPGLEILEVQTNRDITYRLYDWNRRSSDGSFRQLHLSEGMDSVNWNNSGRPLLWGRNGIVETGNTSARYSITAAQGRTEMPPGSVLFLTEGRIRGLEGVAAPACLLCCRGNESLTLQGRGYLVDRKGEE